MNRDVAFGQYYPSNSVVHKLDPRTKIILIIAYIVGVFLVDTLYSYVAVALFLIVAVSCSKVPIFRVLKSLKGVIFIVLFTAVLNMIFNQDGEVIWWRITTGGIRFSISMTLRLVLLVVGTTILTLTTTPMSLTDGIESLMKPLKYIKVPVHDIAVIMSIALRFIPILMEEVDKIMLAQKARGASFDNGGIIKRAKALIPVLVPLFVSSFRRAMELAQALDARCYNATDNRTKMKPLHFSYRDPIATLITAAYIVLVIAINNSFWIAGFTLPTLF